MSATAFTAYLDAQDGEDDPALLADFLAHWLRPGEEGSRRLPSGRVLDDAVASDLTPIPVLTDNRVCPGAP